MVSLVWGVISASLGLLVFLLVPMLAGAGGIHLRQKVGRWFTSLMMKCYQQLAFVRRVFGGYDLYPMAINDDRKMGEVTVSSGVISDDKKLPFRDPDSRIKRLQGKPVCELEQDIPAAISPELSELGHWLREHDDAMDEETCTACNGAGRTVGELCQACDGHGENTIINPYVEMDSTMRVSDPRDALALVGSSVEPETITTAETLTEKRFSEYDNDIGAVEVTATFVGFAVGAFGLAGLQYVRQNVLDGGGGGGPPTSSPIPLMLDGVAHVSTNAADMAVMLL